MQYLVTGSAGFIGFHVSRRLLSEGHTVTGLDGMTGSHHLRLKRQRLDVLREFARFTPVEMMLEDGATLRGLIAAQRPEIVVHLAAQAGVRQSMEAPQSYIDANIVGTFNLLEALRGAPPKHLLLASSSSVYGGNPGAGLAESERTDFPLSLYAATKKAAEAMSHTYAHLYDLPTTCFRFFTVYGPWGRPDMALFKFVAAIARGEPIDVYGQGKMLRDFTYIDDLVEAIIRLIGVVPDPHRPATGATDSLSPVAPWRTVNIGGGQPVELSAFIATIEVAVGGPALRRMLDVQQGEVPTTQADIGLLQALTGYVPSTPIDVGIRAFVEWYNSWVATTAADDIAVASHAVEPERKVGGA